MGIAAPIARDARQRVSVSNGSRAYPRDSSTPAFQQLVAQVHAILTNSVLHDEATVAEPKIVTPEETEEAAFAPLPNVNLGEVMGLVQMLRPEPEMSRRRSVCRRRP